MQKFLELFQQEDGSTCALQVALVFSFLVVIVVWAFIALSSYSITHTLTDIPLGIGGLLSSILICKVWKDNVDKPKV